MDGWKTILTFPLEVSVDFQVRTGTRCAFGFLFHRRFLLGPPKDMTRRVVAMGESVNPPMVLQWLHPSRLR